MGLFSKDIKSMKNILLHTLQHMYSHRIESFHHWPR